MNSSQLISSNDNIICTRDLSVTKGGQVICRAPDFTVSGGERIGIIGPNGSGKSTLFRLLARLDCAFTGECRVNVEPRERVYVHQSPYLFPGSVLDNVTYGLVARSIPRIQRREMAHQCLTQMEMVDFADRNVKQLSGGEQRRVAIARACVLKPKLLLLDEPLADLDPAGVQAVHKTLAGLVNSTILITAPISLPVNFVQRCIELA